MHRKKLLDTARTGYDESKALIERWHGRERLMYAITPRFAATSTRGQLEAAGASYKQGRTSADSGTPLVCGAAP